MNLSQINKSRASRIKCKRQTQYHNVEDCNYLLYADRVSGLWLMAVDKGLVKDEYGTQRRCIIVPSQQCTMYNVIPQQGMKIVMCRS